MSWNWFVIVALQIPDHTSAVSLDVGAVPGVTGNGFQLTPDMTPGLIDPMPFLLGKFLSGNEFSHRYSYSFGS